jgi:class 3 adenylate cyclase
LNSQGSTVACIFLFCDIRSFTDATECLQEEVFVFTNRIAAVIHSICHSYGGSANKNVGDAFLVSWLLEDESSGAVHRFNARSAQTLSAKHHQADKALLSVVKICMALNYDDYYIETMSDNARTALVTKLKNRPGPIVQMGFGLHAGKAVQGAIGSQRKIDATYVSEAVERAEFLESSTKQYGLKLLMSDTFHQLLHPSNRRRCRKIDQIIFHNEDDEDDTEEAYDQDIMELFTYDLDVDTDWRTRKGKQGEVEGSSDNEESVTGTRRDRTVGPPPTRQAGSLLKKTRRLSMRSFDGKGQGSDELRSGSVSVSSEAGFPTLAAAKAVSASDKAGSTFFELDKLEDTVGTNELVLPTGPSLYSANVWLQADMRRVRNKYSPQFFTTFNSGLQRYYSKDWVGARQCFETVLERFDDGPSKYFLEEMKKDNWKPPPDFQGYGKA